MISVVFLNHLPIYFEAEYGPLFVRYGFIKISEYIRSTYRITISFYGIPRLCIVLLFITYMWWAFIYF